jgi:flagellar basal body-associated protein FliL
VNKTILIVVGIVLAGLAGTAYMTNFFGGEEVGKENIVDERPFQYVSIPAVVVTFINGSTVRYVQVVIQLQSRDEVSVTLLKDNIPLIQSVMLLEIGEYDFNELQTSAGKVAMMVDLEVKIRDIFKDQPDLLLDKVVLTGFVVQ